VTPVKITARNIMFTVPMVYQGQTYALNMGLILGRQYNYVIDTGFGSGSIEPILAYLGNDPKPIIVVNTHFHWDHVWGNWMFPNSIIIAYTACRELMEQTWDEEVRENAEFIDGEVHKHLPNLLINDSIYFPDDGIKIFHTPGHSPDCISIYDEVYKVLYAGDNIGDTDEDILPHIGTDVETFKDRVIDAYKQYDFDMCISGHNKPQGRDVVSRMEAALLTTQKHGVSQ